MTIFEKALVPVWSTVAAAAPLFGMGERRVIELIRSGMVKGYQANQQDDARRSWWVDTRSLDRYHGDRAAQYQGEADLVAQDALRRMRK
ncbi:MAG: hypothetical protein HZB23_13745 [Deltaproteobacteria bacterium]|nr:hypothetical protein [Deltaproteobacteria bacterium]